MHKFVLIGVYPEPVTVIESTWPENLFAFQPRVFPNDLSHAKTTCDCNGILRTHRTAVDRHNSLIWLVDNGSPYCAPKLIVFDLIRGNAEVTFLCFTNCSAQLISAYRQSISGTSIRVRQATAWCNKEYTSIDAQFDGPKWEYN